MNKVMIVTGGSRGIGAEISRLAASRGYAVCVNYHSRSSDAEALVAEINGQGDRAIPVQADVSDAEQVEALFQKTEAEFGPVTAVTCNAGITGTICRFDEVDPKLMEQVVKINTLGALYCAQAAVKRMSTKHGGKGGVITTVSSIAARLGSPGEYIWYAASKAAVDSMTIGLAKEVGCEGIRVNAVSPGIIDTEIHASGGEPGRVARIAPIIPQGRAGTAQEVANAVIWLGSEEASYCNGTILDCSGGR